MRNTSNFEDFDKKFTFSNDALSFCNIEPPKNENAIKVPIRQFRKSMQIIHRDKNKFLPNLSIPTSPTSSICKNDESSLLYKAFLTTRNPSKRYLIIQEKPEFMPNNDLMNENVLSCDKTKSLLRIRDALLSA